MGLFNFFGEGEHRVFNYKPIYYDPAEEERKRKFGAIVTLLLIVAVLYFIAKFYAML